MDIDNGNGGAITKTNIAKTSFTGWWPDTSAYPYTVDGYNCEGGAAYGSNVLLIRNYKDSTQATPRSRTSTRSAAPWMPPPSTAPWTWATWSRRPATSPTCLPTA